MELNDISSRKPTKNGYIESFNGKIRQACLDQHLFLDLQGGIKNHRSLEDRIQ
ncbi:integrase core domain-containing protein [Candidatus Protochlamydia sp. W-9]|uniref:integrase core domain-containing protein n=1 Tax=Candidatus Protochlamydia sp. W-9 TaxID=1785087 RepID=UPI0009AD5F6F